MRNQERIAALLTDQYYTHPQGGGVAVKTRFDAGDVKVEFGEENWRKDWYADPWFNVSVPLVMELVAALPAVKEYKLSYDPKLDFHHIWFDFDGETYIIEWYKVFSVYRKSDCKNCSFGYRKIDIAGWFRRGEHKLDCWYGGPGRFNPFNAEVSLT